MVSKQTTVVNNEVSYQLACIFYNVYCIAVYYLVEWEGEDSMSVLDEKSVGPNVRTGATVPVRIGKKTFHAKVISSGLVLQ